MAKKIAVYANGWSRDALFSAIEGIKKYAEKEDFDIFVFMSHAAYGVPEDINEGELSVYELGDIRDFDGVIVFSTMLNSDETVASICRRAQENGVPVVSIGKELEGIPSVCVDNEAGMRQLVTHLVEVHKIKRAVFLGGTPDHVDSIARLRVTREVLESHGLKLDPDDIYYGEWGYEKSILVADQMIVSEKGLPDVIICANDYMALSVASELRSRGYRVPEDVAVTGFDKINEGQIFYPALTSVAQDFEKIGYECCRILYGGTDGDGQKPPRIQVPTKATVAESCGCLDNPYYVEKRKDYCGNSYLNTLRNGRLDQNERLIQLYHIATATDFDSLKETIQYFYENHHEFEGPDFSLILSRPYIQNVMADEAEILGKGRDKELEVAVALKDGKHCPGLTVDRHTLVPGYEKEEGRQHVYAFLPLHSGQYSYGYMVYWDLPLIMTGDSLYTHLERLQQALRSLRINLRLATVNRKLTQIYDKDPMTNLFNRFGYEDKALPLFESCKEHHSTMMVMFVDINYMKRINDIHGHIHGDNAIRTVAKSIKHMIRDDGIAIRFGGDEFLLIATDCDQAEAERVKQGILDYLEQKNEDGTRPYRISVSCGYVLTDPDKDLTLQDYIREADGVMYEIKRQVHANDNK